MIEALLPSSQLQMQYRQMHAIHEESQIKLEIGIEFNYKLKHLFDWKILYMKKINKSVENVTQYLMHVGLVGSKSKA